MTTAVQVQYRRGTAAQVAAFAGAQGELIVDTTNNRVVVQDGSSAGGWPAARLVDIPGGAKNIFRNGTMDIWQRGTASLTVTTSGAYTADGWIVVPAGASCGAQAGAGRLVTAKSLQVYGGTGVTDVLVKQRIESCVAARLTSQTVTVQAQVWNSTGAAITPALTVKHAGAADNWTSPVTDVNAASLQSCAAGAWTQVAYTFIDTGYAANGLEVSFDFGNNFSTSSKSIQLAECDISVTPALVTGLNGSPPLPELRPLASEMSLCQRYYLRLGGAVAADLAVYGYGTTALSVAYPQPMRVPPTGTIVGSWIESNVSSATLYCGTTSLAIILSAASSSAVTVCQTAGTSTYLTFSAEL
jgi:hypothetical protein